MNELCKRIKDDDGTFCDDESWHLFMAGMGNDCCRVLCTGEAYDASSELELEIKHVKKGGITCNVCLCIIKEYKAVKL